MNLPVSSSGVEAEQVPVTALHSLLHLGLAVGHAALDAVHLAGSIADDEGRAVDRPRPRLNGLDGLRSGWRPWRPVPRRRSRSSWRSQPETSSCDLLTGSGELCHLADVGGLGSLSAGVGVNLGVEDEDVDVLAGSEDMVHDRRSRCRRPSRRRRRSRRTSWPGIPSPSGWQPPACRRRSRRTLAFGLQFLAVGLDCSHAGQLVHGAMLFPAP